MTDTNFAHLATRVFNVPLALHPAKAEVVVASLANRLGIARIDSANFRADVEAFTSGDPRARQDVGYDLAEGVAIISVHGMLVQRSGYLKPVCGMTGYDGIRQNVLSALIDPQVKAILFDVDSPGGECAGCFDLVDTIHAARGEKPMWAIASEMAYSAAYAIASAADKVIVPRTGGVGSIGVITMHMDWSDALSDAGLKVTIIKYGDHKADGNPYQRLPKDVQARIQADINTMGELFVETVARNRGTSASTIRRTQALCYMGSDGKAAGLADRVASPADAFAQLWELVRKRK
jgi:signal peptide peptidase SppA